MCNKVKIDLIQPIVGSDHKSLRKIIELDFLPPIGTNIEFDNGVMFSIGEVWINPDDGLIKVYSAEIIRVGQIPISLPVLTKAEFEILIEDFEAVGFSKSIDI